LDALQNAGIGNLLNLTFNDNAHFFRRSVWQMTEIHSPFSSPDSINRPIYLWMVGEKSPLHQLTPDWV